MDYLLAGLIIFIAIFVQTVAGFGMALVGMPLLVSLFGIQVAAPLIALVGLVAEGGLLMHYREALSLKAVVRLAAASLMGIPVGLFAARLADEHLVTLLLGVLVLGYTVYALLGPRLPELKGHFWAYLFGLFGGLLSGAYNTGGPPVIIYGSLRRWEPGEFKSNLQGYFLFNSVVVAGFHALAGSYHPPFWGFFWAALPATGLAMLAGFSLDRHINPAIFRRIVLALLLVLGIRLLIASV
jgi:uncharacterized membrane protein YfcA